MASLNIETEPELTVLPSDPTRPERDLSSSTNMTTTSPRPFDIQSLTIEEVGTIWGKLRQSAFGDYQLDHDDSYELLCLISSLVKTDATKTIDEVTDRILQGISDDHVHDFDEAHMKHLITSYSKLIDADDEVSLASSEQSENQDQTAEHQKELPLGDDLALIERLRLPADALMLLGHIREWNFDIFQLPQYTPYPLVAVAETALNEMKLTFSMDVNMMKLRRFLVDIADAYLPNTYHNQLHAADVTQTMYHFLSSCHLSQALGLNNLAVLSLMIGAAIHDVAHPGVTGKYLIAVGDILAVQYNDNSPLENMHLSTAFQILSKTQNNFMERFPKAMFREFRRLVIEMVLSTDNDRHFGLMEKVESLINSGEAVMALPSPMVRRNSSHKLSRTQSAYSCKPATGGLTSNPSLMSLFATKRKSLDSTTAAPLTAAAPRTNVVGLPPPPAISPRAVTHTTVGGNPQSQVTEARQLLLMQLALHAADVSNPVKPWELHLRWYPRLMNEFYHQGDLERDMGCPISYAFDRLNPVPQPKFQLGFLKAIVYPMYKTFSHIPAFDISHCLSSLENNISNWEAVLASDANPELLLVPEKVVELAHQMGLNGKQWAPKKKTGSK